MPVSIVSAWLDGTTVDTDTFSGTLFPSASPLTIGERGDPGVATWTGGDLDEIAIFNTAVSDMELLELFDQGRGQFHLAG
ncbi:hypothetical protein ACERK3_11445 [Phycisphaerales bacterium AB-hyl4]|uniref:LamG domain-containing protein n=1 Tax=Natronomicrosphaera hydrolytica TaxID=3242702 RepID=A0ABV4U5M8_9BACT